MKNLSNCKPSEFLKQTNLIKNAVDRWLKATDILSIRKRMPTLTVVPKGASDEERQEIATENRRISADQMRQNLMDILDAVLDKYPDETLEIIALCCFIDPAEIDNYKVADLLTAVTELISDEAVVGFFTSLARLGLKSTLPA